MTGGDDLATALALAIHRTRAYHQRLLQSDGDHERLIEGADHLYRDLLRLIGQVIHVVGLSPLVLTDSPNGRVPDDDTTDRHDLVAGLRGIYGYAVFIRNNSAVDIRDYPILAEYVDGLLEDLSQISALLSLMRAETSQDHPRPA